MPDIHDLPAIERWRKARRIDPHRLKRLRVAFYKNHRGSEAALDELPGGEREPAREEIRFHSLELTSSADSRIDGASKLVFRTHDGLLIESVILRVRSGRTALCISSQVGCAADCSFCATGKLGLLRNLDASEILDQIVQANLLLRDEGRRVRNIVFMGMGEPLHNERAVYGALDVLGDPECFHHPLGQVCVSTVGVPERMTECAERYPRVRMALSLHSARDEVRRELIPLAQKCSLADLHATVAEVARLQDQPVMLEYLMLAGINDSDRDLHALAKWAEGLSVHINLIPYNPIDDAPDLRGTPKGRREQFANVLKSLGFKVTLRYSLGADVGAACGQLVRRENRRD